MGKKTIAIAAATLVVVVVVFAIVRNGEEKVPKSRAGVDVVSPVETAEPTENGPVVEALQTPEKTEGKVTGKGIAAIKRAAKTEKYLFVFFYKDEDEQTRKMRSVFDSAMQKVTDRAESIAINIADSSEKGIVDKFQVNRAPMPLVLALAPSGVVTGAFPVKFDENQLVNAFVGSRMQKCLKALQERKLVFVCVQGKATKSNGAAMQGVRAFKADARFAQVTEVVTIDPADAEEVKFLNQLQIEPRIAEAITVFLMPPGRIVAKLKGATKKDSFVAALMSSCGPGGCGPSGCR